MNSKHVNSEYAIYGLVGTHKKQVMFLLIYNYVTSTPAIFFNFQVKRDGRESNRATKLSPPPRLKMIDIKQNQQTTEKSKVYIILPPPPKKKEKIEPVGERLKTRFFYRLEKNNTTLPPPPTPHHPKKNYPRVQSSPVPIFHLAQRLFVLSRKHL